ncbi:unnamed protein product [Mesocestoides corti]|uniref:Rad4 beta-hairpin domain-containing protein n=1 Tax=Mesocestoides corti TaxID=53468 RepID=A0A0R3U500_MESCO|nr:unnamed protein product [Mesocestoides corti]
MPSLRTRRCVYKSPYFDQTSDVDNDVKVGMASGVTSSSDEFMVTPKVTRSCRRKSKTRRSNANCKGKSRKNQSNALESSASDTTTSCKKARTASQSRAKTENAKVVSVVPQLQSDTESSDADGWEDVTNHTPMKQPEALPSTCNEIEFMSQLLEKPDEKVAVKKEEKPDLVVSVNTAPNQKPSRDPKTLAALALAKQLREHQYAVHTLYVIGFLTYGRFANKACDDPTIRALAYSLIDPPKVWDPTTLRSIVSTFACLVRGSVKIKNPNITEAVQARLEIGRTSVDDCTFLLVAALRACGLDARLVLAFVPPPLRRDTKALCVKRLKRLNPPKKNTNIISTSESEEGCGSHEGPDYHLFGQVYLPSAKAWSSVDLTLPVGRATVESFQFPQYQYVVGFHSTTSSYVGRSPIDLAPRYDPAWMSESRSKRIPDSVWNKLLASMRNYCDGDVAALRAEDTTREEEMRDAADLRVIFDYLQTLPLPKRIQDFKGHPLYALRRHLLKFEVIHPPDAPVIGFLNSWLKEAKTVKLGEKPAKVVKAMMSMKRKLLMDDNGPPPTVDLYGPWQVEDYVPPVAENGLVPRNEHGNVELFKPCMLPVGCTHIRLQGIQHIAKRLQIDIAPAMVGWTFHKAGWAHPEYDGFVVCKESVPVLVDAWRAEKMNAEKAAAADKAEHALSNWRRVTRHLLLWQRVEAKFKLTKATVTSSVTGSYYSLFLTGALGAKLGENAKIHSSYSSPFVN